jgi:ribosomal-protein-alanine N-acetyltransferase
MSDTLLGRRLLLRPLEGRDFAAWQEVRRRNGDWLTRWEPSRLPGHADVVENRDAFVARCSARSRERQLGTGYGFGMFLQSTGALIGEVNLSSVQRGPFQNGYVGYWVDQEQAGLGLTPEGVVVLAKYAFEDLHLHRLQIAIIPRNHSSRRVVEKLGLREEGVALRYLEINGVWEDHVRFALTVEEWDDRRDELLTAWVA